MKVTFESEGVVKMAEKWLHKNVIISLEKTVTSESSL